MVLETRKIYGTLALIDTKPPLPYTRVYQEQETRHFISQIDLSLDLEGIKNEVPKMPICESGRLQVLQEVRLVDRVENHMS